MYTIKSLPHSGLRSVKYNLINRQITPEPPREYDNKALDEG